MGKKYLDEYYCPTSIYQVKLYSSQQANLTHFGTVYITPKCDTYLCSAISIDSAYEHTGLKRRGLFAFLNSNTF